MNAAHWILSVIIAMKGAEVLLMVARIGKPVKPAEPGIVAGALLVQAAVIVGLVVVWNAS